MLFLDDDAVKFRMENATSKEHRFGPTTRCVHAFVALHGNAPTPILLAVAAAARLVCDKIDLFPAKCKELLAAPYAGPVPKKLVVYDNTPLEVLPAIEALFTEHLEKLWVRYDVKNAALVEGVAALAGRKCPHLRTFVGNYSAATDAAIISVAEHCHKLEYLSVNFSEGVTDTSIKAVAANCPQLQELDVRWAAGAITESSLAPLRARGSVTVCGP